MYIYGDHAAYSDEEEDIYYDDFYLYGREGDGDDIIDVGENPGVSVYVMGQGGNDKIIGGLQLDGGSNEYLYGGNGDDKIWAHNPGQHDHEDADGENRLYGGEGNDIIYGSNRMDYLYGDSEYITDYGIGGDDIIYSGYGDDSDAYDYIYGGKGDDKIYGQGNAYIYAYGEWGDDLIHGTEQGDYIEGDDSGQFGDDTLYGHGGDDDIEGAAGDDFIDGGEGDDDLYGDEGEDTIYGGEGDDYIHTGTGWDTVFGGEGCDYIYSYDGGDVIWGGECIPDENAKGAHDYQLFHIYGTGPDPENFTVIMDFWREDAYGSNFLCLHPDERQDMPGAGACGGVDNSPSSYPTDCLSATDIIAARSPDNDVARTRGVGCVDDNGPLWITV